jgi:hypothetical protein
MKQKLMAFTLVLFLGTGMAWADHWLHVRVSESDDDGEQVSVNIPLSVVQAILPAIETDEFRGGRIKLNSGEIEGIDLREILKAFRESPDADFVTVDGDDEKVRVSKERGMLLVNVDGDDETVRVRLPLDVVEALLAGGEDELDLMAALNVLAQTGGDIVTVESDDESIRVWIDSDSEGR